MALVWSFEWDGRLSCMMALKHESFSPFTISTVLVGPTHLSPLELKAPEIKVTDFSPCALS